MPGNYSHTTRSNGTVLTALIYNGDHTNHIDNLEPLKIDDYSLDAPQMRVTTDPGESGTESLATTLGGELARIRFALKEIKEVINGAAVAQWYSTVATLTIPNTAVATLKDVNFTLQDDGDVTKQGKFQLSGLTTGNTRTLTWPDFDGTIATLAGTETLTGKTLTGNIAVNLISGAATITLPTTTGTLATLANAETLTNKTITTFGGAFTFNPLNLSATLSPTGTGTVTINPATAGAMNNMAIGGSTPLAGAFTTLSASSTLLVTGNVTLSSLTITRVPYASTAGLLIDASTFTFTTTGAILTVGAINVAGTTAPTVGLYNPSGTLLRTPNSLTVDGNLIITGTGQFNSTLTMVGTAANIALGSNYISNGGTDVGGQWDVNNHFVNTGHITSRVLASGWTAFGANSRAVEVGFTGNAFWGASQNQVMVTGNYYYDGVDRFGGTGYAGRLFFNNGIWTLDTSNASGLAAGIITWISPITVSAAGNTTLGGSLSTSAPVGGAGAWELGIANVVSPSAPNRTLTVEIGGTAYYISAKTTND